MIPLKVLLKEVVSRNASDLHLKVGSPPVLRIDGALTPLDHDPLTSEDTSGVAGVVMNSLQKERFFRDLEMDLAYTLPGVGRFRTNLFLQKGYIGIVMRYVKTDIPTFEEINLPVSLRNVALSQRGIILLCGTTGSGKSTTLACMVEHINKTRSDHIITIEDPIEYLFVDKKSIINQREVGIDTESFFSALNHVMREDPDVIVIGEMRDWQSIMAAMTAAETGHLVFSSLHADDCAKTVDRILDFFQETEKDQMRAQLSLTLRAVVAQRLVSHASGEGVVPACEIMLVDSTIRDLIRENRIDKIPVAIQTGGDLGMRTFNQDLVRLVREGKISEEDALIKASNPEALKMNLQGIFLDEGKRILEGI